MITLKNNQVDLKNLTPIKMHALFYLSLLEAILGDSWSFSLLFYSIQLKGKH